MCNLQDLCIIIDSSSPVVARLPHARAKQMVVLVIVVTVMVNYFFNGAATKALHAMQPS